MVTSESGAKFIFGEILGGFFCKWRHSFLYRKAWIISYRKTLRWIFGDEEEDIKQSLFVDKLKSLSKLQETRAQKKTRASGIENGNGAWIILVLQFEKSRSISAIDDCYRKASRETMLYICGYTQLRFSPLGKAGSQHFLLRQQKCSQYIRTYLHSIRHYTRTSCAVAYDFRWDRDSDMGRGKHTNGAKKKKYSFYQKREMKPTSLFCSTLIRCHDISGGSIIMW